ncbi:hypothetical protein [Companilactobacillus hulinensis]|uniref:hypothetical protein n=1 Tax=Companilactobacillus hulinensis TaxID=2486007 RepID=UPI000F77F08C|nr:hypothetical protein [Companilactobacillus hulinensis]
MDLTIELIDKIGELTLEAHNNKTFEVGDKTYSVDGRGNIHLVIPPDIADRSVNISTLTGLVDLIQNMDERKDRKLFVQIKSPSSIDVYGAIDSYGQREKLIEVNASLPEIYFEQFLDQESMNIMLQSQFVDSDDQELLLKVIGNLKEEEVTSSSDDGTSQAVTIKSGVASVSKVKVPNPVTLAPYRTFIEVAQPESKFVFRMREGMCAAIFEADGGAWKNKAMQNISEYLKLNLGREIKADHVVVIS